MRLSDLPLFSLVLSSRVKLVHHGDKLVEINLVVTVFVHLLDDGLDCLGRHLVLTSKREHLSDLVSRDGARVVLVKHPEGGLEPLLGGQRGLVRGGQHKLRVVDEATVVQVHGAEHLLHFLVRHYTPVVLQVALLDLIHGELPVVVLVKGLEDFGKVLTLSLVHQLGCDEGESRVLQRHVTVEVLQVGQSALSSGLVHLNGGQLSDPRVQEGLFSGGTGTDVVGQQGADKALRVLTDCVPDAVVK